MNRLSGIVVADRPYVLTFPATGTSYPATSEDVRCLLAEYPVRFVNGTTVRLRADDGQRVTIRPATLGGGAAFTKAGS